MSIELTLERVAHGGIVVGHTEGKVVFVTGGLPGERVRVDVTQTGKRFDRGEVVEVLEAAPGRVEPPCPVAGRCGGCDWQHADASTQLDLKTAVVAEQLQRLAGIEWDGRVEAVDGGLTGWRTRLRFATDDDGNVGFRGRRSHEIVALPPQGCLIAVDLPYPDIAAVAEPGGEVVVAVADNGTAVLGPRRRLGPDPVRQSAQGRDFLVAANGFWQSHRSAPDVLCDVVLEGLAPRPGESALDLYCGVGLFAGALVDAGCTVTGVEASRQAVAAARHNVPEATFIDQPMERAAARLPRQVDLVVLDPPRKGAGADMVRAVVAREPRAIAYVACDPAALGRDLATFAEEGYEPTSIRGFDLFPMTHHVECVAILRRSA